MPVRSRTGAMVNAPTRKCLVVGTGAAGRLPHFPAPVRHADTTSGLRLSERRSVRLQYCFILYSPEQPSPPTRERIRLPPLRRRAFVTRSFVTRVPGGSEP